MSPEKSIILPYREYAISTRRLLLPYHELLIADGTGALEQLAFNCVEFLFQYRVQQRQAWRSPQAYTSLALKSAFHQFDTYPDAPVNAEIVLAPVIECIEGLLDSLIPHRTMDVYTVERAFGELLLTNYGDYRILKFMEEHPNWKPTSEEPETLVLNSLKRTNFPTF